MTYQAACDARTIRLPFSSDWNRPRALTRATAILVVSLPLLAASAYGPAAAARIERSNQQPCSVLLKGLIETGDAARLSKALDEAEHPYSVCLDSPGGSFTEGVKMIEVILDKGETGTIVQNGAECHSVCAYVFMAGRRDFHHGTLVPKRSLHVGGKLGFQIAPVVAEGAILNKEVIEKIYRDGVRTVGALLKQNAKAGGKGYRDQLLPYPQALVVDALKTEPGKLLPVDTVERAGRYGINLFGYMLPALTTSHLRRACAFHSRWDGPILSSPLNYADMATTTDKGETVNLKPGEVKRIALSQFGPKADRYCVADLWQSKRLGLFIHYSFDTGPKSKDRRRANYFSEDATTKEETEPEIFHPTWYVFPPDTKLADLIDRQK